MNMAIAVSAYCAAWDCDWGTDHPIGLKRWLEEHRYKDGQDQVGPRRSESPQDAPPALSVLARESVGPPHPGDVPDFDDITGEYLPDLELARVKWDARVKWEAFHGKQAYKTPLPPRP